MPALSLSCKKAAVLDSCCRAKVIGELEPKQLKLLLNSRTWFYVRSSQGWLSLGPPIEGAGLRIGRVPEAVQSPTAPSLASTRPVLTLTGVWAFASVALPVVASLEAAMSSVDLAYQVRAGDLMLSTHHLL